MIVRARSPEASVEPAPEAAATAEPAASEGGLAQPEVAPTTEPEAAQPGAAPAPDRASGDRRAAPRTPTRRRCESRVPRRPRDRRRPVLPGDGRAIRRAGAPVLARHGARLGEPRRSGVAARGRPGRRHGQRHAVHLRAPAAARGREARAAARRLVRMDAARARARGCRARGRQGVRGADRRTHARSCTTTRISCARRRARGATSRPSRPRTPRRGGHAGHGEPRAVLHGHVPGVARHPAARPRHREDGAGIAQGRGRLRRDARAPCRNPACPSACRRRRPSPGSAIAMPPC